jgi:hypothetical protein
MLANHQLVLALTRIVMLLVVQPEFAAIMMAPVILGLVKLLQIARLIALLALLIVMLMLIVLTIIP